MKVKRPFSWNVIDIAIEHAAPPKLQLVNGFRDQLHLVIPLGLFVGLFHLSKDLFNRPNRSAGQFIRLAIDADLRRNGAIHLEIEAFKSMQEIFTCFLDASQCPYSC